MEFKFVVNAKLEDLAKEVNKYFAKGWQPLGTGPMCHKENDVSFQYVQMIQKSE